MLKKSSFIFILFLCLITASIPGKTKDTSTELQQSSSRSTKQNSSETFISEMQQDTKYLVYYSLVSRPCIHYQKMYKRNPTADEYYAYLTNNIPWEIPFGGIKNLDYILNQKDGTAKLTYTDPKSQKPKTIYFNTNSVTGLTAKEISSNLGISLDEYKDYEMSEYLLEMLNGANWNFAADNHRLPKSIDELNSVLGLQLKSNTSLEDYGIKIVFNVNDVDNNKIRNAAMFTNPRFPIVNSGSNKANPYRFLDEPALIRGLLWPPS